MDEIKHIFLINAHSVKGKRKEWLKKNIISVCEQHAVNYEMYDTNETDDIGRYAAAEKNQNHQQKILRFYACGGDGTLHQVANAVFGDSNVQVATIPLGTGNDFVKSFTNYEHFMDIGRQIRGKAAQIDVITHGEKIAVNMVNIGFDCMVVAKTQQTKKWPLIKGPAAYLAAVALVLKEMPLSRQQVFLDGERVPQETFLLTAIANGSYCGGGFNAASKAILNDGYLDVLLVDPINRRKFLSLVGMYKKGTLLDSERVGEVLRFQRCRKVEIISEEPSLFCSDGEIFSFQKDVFQIAHKAVSFAVPEGCRFKNQQ
jgi:diacylglycerol kinase (ATP)